MNVLAESSSLCPECFAVVACRYVEQDGVVVQEKECRLHGAFSSPYWDDVEHYRWTRSFDADASNDGACCGGTDSCDMAGAPGRKRCLAVIDVTDNCNLECSYCFASSRPGLQHRPVEEVYGLLETVLRESGGPTPIQLSGGEPTTRHDLPEIVAAAREMGFTHIELNSNGLRLADQKGYAQELADAGVSVVYLQFDGFGKAVYEPLREMDLTDVKAKALAACRSAGLQVILVPMVVKGVNDHQLGDIVRFGLQNLDVVRGINFQPVSHFGRHAEDRGHMSLPAVADALAKQTGFLQQRDLLQVPCCSPQCSSATMLLSRGEGREAIPLTRFVSETAYRDVVEAFEATHYMDLLAGQREGVAAAKDAAGCCGIAVPEGLERLLPRMLAVTITGFMDADTVDLQRLSSCCINVPTKEGRLVPFCGYNLTSRDGQYMLRKKYQQVAGGLPVVA